MAIRAVVFDVGETLVDETRAWSDWADWLGIPRLTLFAVLGAVIAHGQDHRELPRPATGHRPRGRRGRPGRRSPAARGDGRRLLPRRRPDHPRPPAGGLPGRHRRQPADRYRRGPPRTRCRARPGRLVFELGSREARPGLLRPHRRELGLAPAKSPTSAIASTTTWLLRLRPGCGRSSSAAVRGRPSRPRTGWSSRGRVPPPRRLLADLADVLAG